MALFDKFKAILKPLQPQENSGNQLFKAIYSFFNGFYYTLTTGLETFVKEGYQKNISVYSAVKLISGKGAAAKFYAYTYKGEEIVKLPPTHPANILLRRPNEFQKQQQFIEDNISWLSITGNLFLYVLKNPIGKNEPLRVYSLPSQYVQIIGGGVLEPVKEYKLIIGNQQIIFKADEIIHLKYFNPEFGINGEQLYGQSPLRAGLQTIQSSNEGTLTKIKSFINGGVAGILSTKDTDISLTVEQKSNLQDFINQRVMGAKNAKNIRAVDTPVEFTQIGMSPADLEVLKSIQFDEQALVKSLGIDPILFSTDSASYNNKSEAYKSLVNNVVVPILNLLCETYSDIFNDPNIFIGYDISHFPEMQEDLKQMVDALNKAYWIKPNEKRAKMGLPEDKDPLLDKYYVPNNLTPLEEVSVMVDTDIKNYGDYR